MHATTKRSAGRQISSMDMNSQATADELAK